MTAVISGSELPNLVRQPAVRSSIISRASLMDRTLFFLFTQDVSKFKKVKIKYRVAKGRKYRSRSPSQRIKVSILQTSTHSAGFISSFPCRVQGPFKPTQS